jgi:hypothetical protein
MKTIIDRPRRYGMNTMIAIELEAKLKLAIDAYDAQSEQNSNYMKKILSLTADRDRFALDFQDLTAKLKVAEEALVYYADEDGGPYAAGDWHTADGGRRAAEALTTLRGGKGEG